MTDDQHADGVSAHHSAHRHSTNPNSTCRNSIHRNSTHRNSTHHQGRPRDPFKEFRDESEVVEEVIENGRSVRRRGIYLLPNVFTTLALFSGFFAVISALNHDFSSASVAIFVAMVLDGVDGRVARMTNTQSAFGAEYDSLADMLSFGIAPAVVAFSWMQLGGISEMGKFGWICTFIYVACAALRLARFNVQLTVVDKAWFVGLPSPTAAAIVAGCVWVLTEFQTESFPARVLLAVVVAASGMLMVSNIHFYSFKKLDVRSPVPFVALLAIILLIVLIWAKPPVTLLLLFGGYTLVGVILAAMRMLRSRRSGPAGDQDDAGS